MADTTGQIVFASKFGSSCMKNEVGGIYCIRTVQTVAEVFFTKEASVNIL